MEVHKGCDDHRGGGMHRLSSPMRGVSCRFAFREEQRCETWEAKNDRMMRVIAVQGCNSRTWEHPLYRKKLKAAILPDHFNHLIMRIA